MSGSIGKSLASASLPAATGAARSTPWLARIVNDWPWARRFLSGLVIEVTSGGCPPRPHPLSLWSPPGSAGDMPPWAARGADPALAAAEVRRHAQPAWPSQVDRSFSGRHLAPAPDRPLPPVEEVAELYRRPLGPMRQSAHNSVLLCFFAQWFTDSFLRTAPTDMRRNTSNHEIDFCQVYGLDEIRTRALRAGEGGRLASRETADGEWLPLLLRADGTVDPRFAAFDYVQPVPGSGKMLVEAWMAGVGLSEAEIAERRGSLYATGLERGSTNIGYTACSTLFLREHNRIARAIQARHPAWTDDRIFETARSTVIAIGLKLVIEDYIVQLSQTPFRLVLDPDLAPRRPWYRANRIAIEFNLLYRWHSMVPDAVTLGGQEIRFHDLQFNNALLEFAGLEAAVDALSRQPAGYIGLRNVPDFLMGAELGAQRFARQFALQPMNAYRKHFGLNPLTSFDSLTDDPGLRDALRSLYRNRIDEVEFLPGMFAEEERGDASFGSLLMRMVGYDAFTQALTNPLLSPQLFCEETFSDIGWEAIHETRTIDDVFRRNTRARADQRASLGLS
jgi:prostaglandin-endoperoxide synthase 2